MPNETFDSPAARHKIEFRSLETIKSIGAKQLLINPNKNKHKDMKKKVFIGIDFSKLTIDVSVLDIKNLETVIHSQFENNTKGFGKMMKWLKKVTNEPERNWLFCGEHTGVYVLALVSFLVGHGLPIWLESALRIKRSRGLCRGKDDKSDSRDIALYAYRYRDKAKEYSMPMEIVANLKDLMSYRERLKKSRHSLKVSCKELKRAKPSDAAADYIYNKSQENIKAMDKDMKEVEKKMLSLIKENEEVKKNYDIITSVKGIGPVNAILFIVATNNFDWFDDARQFACHSGSAPFKHESGTSVKSGDKVSPLANRKIKTALSLAATSAVQHNPQYKAYYRKKTAEGKKHFLVINNIRNKLIHLVFALVRTGKKYEENYCKALPTAC